MRWRRGRGKRAGRLTPWSQFQWLQLLTSLFHLSAPATSFQRQVLWGLKLSLFSCCPENGYFLQQPVQMLWRNRTNKVAVAEVLQSNGAREGEERAGAISDTLLSGKLYPHCSKATGNDFTMASCQMIMTTNVVSDAATDPCLIGWMTSLCYLAFWGTLKDD